MVHTTMAAIRARRRVMMRKFVGTMIQGFVIMLPILATLGITLWLWGMFESILGTPLRWLLGEERSNAEGVWKYIHYYPGMGTALALTIIFVVGMFTQVWLIKAVLSWVEIIFERVPLVKSIYGSFRDLVDFFSSKESRKTSQVVVVTLGDGMTQVLGVMTRDDFSELPKEIGAGGRVSVYIPFAYAMGGFTILVTRSQVQPVDMTMEEAMRFAITAGMAIKSEGKKAHG